MPLATWKKIIPQLRNKISKSSVHSSMLMKIGYEMAPVKCSLKIKSNRNSSVYLTNSPLPLQDYLIKTAKDLLELQEKMQSANEEN